MLKAFKALKVRGVEKVIGGTPRDWKLEGGVYLEIHVRPRSHPKAKAWRDYEEEASSRLVGAFREGAARSAAASAAGGFRRGKNPRSEAAFAKGFKAELEEVKISREDQLDELQSALDCQREHLLLGVYECSSSAAVLDLSPQMDAVTDADDGADLERAERALEDALSPEKLLMRADEPEKRRQLADEEIKALFTAQLPEVLPGEEAAVISSDWSPLFGRATVAQALLRIVADLARHGAEGEKTCRDKEAEEAKKAHTSGRTATPRQETTTGKQQQPTESASPRGNAGNAVSSTSPPPAASVKDTTTSPN